MFKVIKNLFKSRKEKKEKIKKALEFYENHEYEVNERKEFLEKIQYDSRPWYEIITNNVEEFYDYNVKDIKKIYNYNKAFVNQLRKVGFQGTVDEDVVKNWHIMNLVKTMNKFIQMYNEDKKKLPVPWIHFSIKTTDINLIDREEGETSDEYDDLENSITVAIDWNKKFLRNIEERGFKGASDSEVVYNWIKKIVDSLYLEMTRIDYEK